MTETRLNIRISPDKKDAFYKKVEQEGKTVTDVLISLIDQYLGLKTDSCKVLELESRITKLEEMIKNQQHSVSSAP